MSTSIPLACVPGAIPAGERAAHFRLIQHLFGAALLERRETAGGYAYRFDPDALPDVARWAANERRCCPFLTFHLTLTPGGDLWLELTGPEGTAEFLDHELPTGAGA